MPDKTLNVNLNINGYPLDPSRAYILEVKADEMPDEYAHAVVNALQQLKIKHVLVSTKTGDAMNVVEVPEERQ